MYKFFLLSLVVWRLSSLITQEDGPFAMFRQFRMWVAANASRDKQGEFWQSFSEGIHCIWCVSLWISPIVSLCVAISLSEWVIYTFALSTMAIVIDSFVSRNN